MSTEHPAPTSIPHQAARLAADLADFIEKIHKDDTTYGKYHVSKVSIAYDGDDIGLRVVPDEFGGFELTTETFTE